MNESMAKLARKMTKELEKFLRTCKEAGDVTIDDVLKRLEDLKKEAWLQVHNMQFEFLHPSV